MKTILKVLATIPENDDFSSLWVHPVTRGVAINMKTGDREYMIVNGDRQPDYESVRDFVWSLDGKRYAYVGWDGKQDQLVVDGEVEKNYENIDYPTLLWSDNNTLAYVYEKDSKYFVVAGDQSYGPLDNRVPGTGRYYSPLLFRPGSDDIGYAAMRGEYYAMEINGERFAEYDFASDPVFSSNGQVCAYIASTDGHDHEFVVLNNEAGQPYERIKELVLSDDGKEPAYIGAGASGETMDLVINHEILVSAPYIKDLRYSPVHGFACVISDGDGTTQFYVAGKKGPVYNDGVTDPVFSGNGEHFAYVGHKRVVENDIPQPLIMEIVVDGEVMGQHKRVMWGGHGAVAVNKRGDRVACLLYPDEYGEEGSGVGLNGEVDQFFDGIYGSHRFGTLHFDEEGGVGFVAVRDCTVYWVKQVI